MAALLLWLRRSSLTIAVPGLVALVLIAAWSRPGWEYEWDWALSWTASGTILMAPVVAGLCAFDRARRHTPTLTLFEQAAIRGAGATYAHAGAGFLLGFTSWLAGASVVMLWVARNDPAGWPDPSILLEVAVVLLAAAFLGSAIGTWVPNLSAGPVAALVVYGMFALGPSLTLGGLMQAGGAVDTMAGVRSNPQWLVGMVVFHVAIGIAAGLVIKARTLTSRSASAVTLLTAGIVVLGGALVFDDGKVDGRFVRTVEETVCFGSAPTVCGPETAEPMLRIAEVGLRSAFAELADSELPLRDRYVLPRGLPGDVFPVDAGDLTVQPEEFVDGEYSRDEVLYTLTVPTMCEDLFADDAPMDLMHAQRDVRDWMDRRLDGEVAGPAPAEIVASYRMLLDCEPRTGPLHQ